MRRVLVLLAVVALLASAVWAGELAGIKIPDQVTMDGATLHLNGMGIRKKLWIKVYVGALYLEHTTHSAEEAIATKQYRRIEMHFMTNKATKKRMDKAWWEGFEHNSPDKMRVLRGSVEQFVGFFGDMREGDVIAFTITPKGETKVELNGKLKGTLAGEDFAEALLKVWLGPEPPSDDLKEGMLGG